jgi:heme A synthase
MSWRQHVKWGAVGFLGVLFISVLIGGIVVVDVLQQVDAKDASQFA